MPLSDLACYTALDSLECRSILPDGCDPDPLVGGGLIEPAGAAEGPATWRLTVKGRLTLANLRSLARQRQNI